MYYLDILTAFYEQKVKYLVVGGLAVNLHGVPRLTSDLDILIALNKKNVVKMNRILSDLGYVPRVPVNPNDLGDMTIREKWIHEKNMKAFSFYHKKENSRVIDIVILSPVDYETASKHEMIKKAGPIDLHVISLNDLILMKEASGRKQDISDILLLQRMNELKGES